MQPITARWQEWASFALGLWLAMSPWLCGYADQPHLNRDFRAFAGSGTPGGVGAPRPALSGRLGGVRHVAVDENGQLLLPASERAFLWRRRADMVQLRPGSTVRSQHSAINFPSGRITSTVTCWQSVRVAPESISGLRSRCLCTLLYARSKMQHFPRFALRLNSDIIRKRRFFATSAAFLGFSMSRPFISLL